VAVPVGKQGQYLIATIQVALSDADLQKLREDLLTQVSWHRPRGVIVDITVLDVMDSFAVRMLHDIAQMTRLRGTETVIVGMQPEVAISMVQLGLTLEGVTAALDLGEGLAVLDRQTSAARGGQSRGRERR
jgi:rsbT antagonist protein RsbS